MVLVKVQLNNFFVIVGEYTNADEIVSSTGMSNEEAAKKVDQMRYSSIKKMGDFSFETVLSSQYKIDILLKAKEAGYFIKCIFVLTSNPLINIKRVKSRFISGGHTVDKDKIIERYEKSINNIKLLMKICDIMHVYDNTESMVRIIRKHKDDISIFPNEYWTSDSLKKLIYG